MSQFLLKGGDVLKSRPGFKLIGRKEILNDLCSILTQSESNSVIVSGPGGVGISALALALQARKLDDDAPFDIVNKRFFWLDTDNLFGTGDPAAITKEFHAIFAELARTTESVLIVEDTLDLIQALQNMGLTHVINAMNSLVKNKKRQMFLEVRETDLAQVYKAHSDFREHYTFMDIKEPVGDELLEIVTASAASLEKAYDVRIDAKAILSAITLTNKYRSIDTGINRAQPERSRLLLDRAMSKYCLYAHSTPPLMDELEAELRKVALADTEKEKIIRDRIDAHKREFAENQILIKKYYAAQREGENERTILLEAIAELIDKAKKSGQVDKDDEDDDMLAAAAGYTSPVIEAKRKRIEEIEAAIAIDRDKYDTLTRKINGHLLLTEDHVLNEFARISGIDASKLRQDDKAKLIALGGVLKRRVFGQDEALDHIYRSVKVWKRGRRTGKPLPFLFCGPSGVGKTEVGRSLSEGLFDTVAAMNKYDMGDFGEKNAVTKLIGAPPGYEGYDEGGDMTNSIRQNPYQVMLLDEVEKAHAAVFNVFLGILDDGYCRDNFGRRCEFGDAIMPFTTNIGQEHMLRVGTGPGQISREEAYELTLRDLEGFFRPEFLNRFEGRENIMVFNRLEIESMQRIASRELTRINEFFAPKVEAVFPIEQLNNFCGRTYSPKVGARGIPGKIKTVESMIVDQQLLDENFTGVLNIGFDDATAKLTTEWKHEPSNKVAA